MKKIRLLFVLQLCISSITAQTGFGLTQLPTNSDHFRLMDRLDLSKTPMVIGEQRFFKDSMFRTGELRTRKSLITTELVFRFDQVEGTIEAKMVDGSLMYLDEKEVLYCKINYEDHTIVFMPIQLPKRKEMILAQVIYKTNTLQLYRDIKKKITPKLDHTKDNSTILVGEVQNDYHYYLRKNNSDALTEVEIDEKSFIKVLPEKKHRIHQLFKGKDVEKLTLSKLVTMMGELDK
ncbi:MAG: hypothetical protein JNL70_21720 [Saprospiraceae bacterium]|nr:hypothetical protein [Saprospiraceae bacterium]